MQQTNKEAIFDFTSYLDVRRARLEKALDFYLSERSESRESLEKNNWKPSTLYEAMRYSALSGGKRLRAALTIAGAEAVERAPQLKDLDAVELVLPLCAAIEMIHAMSLIHDDLPCLDNDDLRRGKPTNHKVFGEAMALLAGDGLLVMAQEVLLSHCHEKIDKGALLSVSLELCRATGPSGMVGGQVLDMEFTGQSVSEEVVRNIHARKTGALIKFSLWAGGALLQAPERQLQSLARLGEIIGLAFQITDDLLDVTGSAESLGKTPGKDQASNKATWVSIFGVEGAKAKLKEMEKEGKELIKESSLDNPSYPALQSLLSYSINREK
jgi:geranylgeranyl diphosphate synthase type II